MLKVLNIPLVLLSTLVASITTLTTAYYVLEIRPHLHTLDEEIKSNNISSPNARLLKRAMYLVGGKYSINAVKHRTALRFIPQGDRFRGYWHLVGLHWQLWLSIIYNEAEIYALRLARLYFSEGHGISGASRYYFGTDFANLTCQQIVELALLDKAPSFLAPGSERQQQYIEQYNLFSICKGGALKKWPNALPPIAKPASSIT